MRWSRRRRFSLPEHLPAAAALAGLLMLLASGCGGESYKVVPVSGTVTLDGKPLAGIAVTFQPVAQPGSQPPGPGSVGQTDANGRYELQLVVIGGKKKGAVVGKHRVGFATIQPAQDPEDDRRPVPAKELLPPQYRGRQIDFAVPAGGTDKADFPLTSK